MNRTSLLITAGAIALATGCLKHSYTVGSGAASIDGEPAYSKWHSHWLFGIIGETDVKLAEVCPSGNATIKEKVTFVNGLIGALIGIVWKPTTVKVWCGEGGAAAEKPATESEPAGSEEAPAEEGAEEGGDEGAMLEIQLSPEQMRTLALDPRVQEWIRQEAPGSAREFQAALEAHRSRTSQVAVGAALTRTW